MDNRKDMAAKGRAMAATMTTSDLRKLAKDKATRGDG
jgi:hypothetical protein